MMTKIVTTEVDGLGVKVCKVISTCGEYVVISLIPPARFGLLPIFTVLPNNRKSRRIADGIFEDMTNAVSDEGFDLFSLFSPLSPFLHSESNLKKRSAEFSCLP